MIYGDFSFSLSERIMILLGCNLFIQTDGRLMLRSKVTWKAPVWAGEVKRTYKVPDA